MPDKLIKNTGACHCKQVSFEFFAPRKIDVLRCNCSICSMTGFVHLIIPHQQFRLLTGQDSLMNYRFGSEQAEHLFCCHCGVKSFYQPRSHPDSYSINLACVDQSVFEDITIKEFDGQNWDNAIDSIDQ